jgi:hypothetical protein
MINKSSNAKVVSGRATEGFDLKGFGNANKEIWEPSRSNSKDYTFC